MKEVKPYWRAKFREPIGVMNPGKMRCPGLHMSLEVFESSGHWKVRELDSGHNRPLKQFTDLPSHEAARAEAGRAFAEQVEPWSLWCDNPRRPLDPGQYKILQDGTVIIYEPCDYSHVMRPDYEASNSSQKEYPTACGELLPYRYFVSLKVNVPPTCKACVPTFERARKK